MLQLQANCGKIEQHHARHGSDHDAQADYPDDR
jgi:hypothetical protein